MRERELTHQVEVCLNNEMGWLEELHLKESHIWEKMKSHYEEGASVNKHKIENLKKALDEAQNHSQAITNNVCILIQTNQEKFTAQLRTALDKGWMAWAAQATELHTCRVNLENRRKEGQGFYKLNDDSIVAIHEDLAQDYRTLADQHSEELTQLLEDFNKSREDTFHRITEISSTQQRAEPIAISNSDSVEQDEPQPNSNKPSNVTTTLVNETTNMEQGDHRTQTNEPTPDPMTRDPNSPPTEPTITITQREEKNAGTHTPTAYGEGHMETHKMPDQNR